jgi:hypothetical protein
MNLPLQSPHPPSDQLHPGVHISAVALFIWFVAAAWLLFGGPGYIELALAMISVLVFMVIAIPTVLWRAGRKARSANADSIDSSVAPAGAETPQTFGAWLHGEFATWTNQEKGSTAAVEILLPLAAVALGITALGIVLDLTRAGVI